MSRLFLLTAETEMAVDRETAKNDEVKAMISELIMASMPVPAPVGERDKISFQAFRVKVPSFVKKAL